MYKNNMYMSLIQHLHNIMCCSYSLGTIHRDTFHTIRIVIQFARIAILQLVIQSSHAALEA